VILFFFHLLSLIQKIANPKSIVISMNRFLFSVVDPEIVEIGKPLREMST
jgi:hypothetical protein